MRAVCAVLVIALCLQALRLRTITRDRDRWREIFDQALAHIKSLKAPPAA